MSAAEPLFLDVEDVLELHATQLEVYGGAAGLRDRGLLESAVAQPQASFGGEFVHDGLFAMAAGYLFHIVSNHPFVDGNKRAGLLSAIVFLDVNGISIDQPSVALYELTLSVAESRIDKVAVAASSNGSQTRRADDWAAAPRVGSRRRASSACAQHHPTGR